MIGDPLLGPGDDEGASPDIGPPTVPAAAVPDEGEGAPVPAEPGPGPHDVGPSPAGSAAAGEPTRVVPAPVLPPGGLRPGARASVDEDPLWAATTAGPGSSPANFGAHTSPAKSERQSWAELAGQTDPTPTPIDGTAGGGLAPTAAMPGVAGDDLTPTAAMPGVGRAAGAHDTMVMPAAAVAAAPGAEHAPGFAKAMRRHRRRWWRRSFKALLVLIFIGIVYVGVNFALVLRTANADQAQPVDVIVVLGAAQYNGTPSPQLQARLDHTLDLWNEGLASVVFVTGGNQPGDQHTEAESSRDYLVEHGVPADAIRMEDTAHSTWESLSNFAGVAETEGWQRVLLVTDPFHSLRTRLIAQELGFTAYTSPTQTSPVQGREELMKEIKEALGISLGRIIGFERLWKVTG